jgi:hypothetical protein
MTLRQRVKSTLPSRPLRRRTHRGGPVLLATGLAAAAVVTLTAPAANASGLVYYYDASGSAAKGHFTDTNNELTACDLKADGYGAVMFIQDDPYNPRYIGSTVDNNGAGTCRALAGRGGYWMQPGEWYWVQVCLEKSGYTYQSTCGAWHEVYNSN